MVIKVLYLSTFIVSCWITYLFTYHTNEMSHPTSIPSNIETTLPMPFVESFYEANLLLNFVLL